MRIKIKSVVFLMLILGLLSSVFSISHGLASEVNNSLQAIENIAQPLWQVKEITPEMISGSQSFMEKHKRLSASRFYLLGTIRERNPDGTIKTPCHRLLDLTKLTVVDMEVPFKDFPREHLATLGIKELLGAEIIHHIGDTTSMIVDKTVQYKRTATYFVQYNHTTGKYSNLVKLGDHSSNQYYHPLGYDARDQFFYFAFAVNNKSDVVKDGPLWYEISRVDLRNPKIDWQVMLKLPLRAKQLEVNTVVFSPDGGKLALAEYNDRAINRDHPANPPQQVYVIDVADRKIDTYPIPLSTYGAAFTPDSHYLLLGSHEMGTILRIDVVNQKQTHSVQATKTIHEFHMAPSGNYFLVVNNYELSPRKVVDVRNAENLELITSILIEDLFPGCTQGSPGFNGTMDGSFLLTGICQPAGSKGPSGIRILMPPEKIALPSAGSEAAVKLKLAETLARGKEYASNSGVELSEYPMGEFRSAAVSKKGDVFIAGIRDTAAVVAKLNNSGKLLWEQTLPNKQFKEHTGGVLAPTLDGGCVAYFLSYVHPAHMPCARLTRFGNTGKMLWDYNFPGDGAPNSPYANDGLELLPDGSILMKGIICVSKGVEKPWSAVIGADGKLISFFIPCVDTPSSQIGKQ